jgi:adenylate kinase
MRAGFVADDYYRDTIRCAAGVIAPTRADPWRAPRPQVDASGARTTNHRDIPPENDRPMHFPPYPYPTALIFGVPGAGKGTQGDILTQVPGFFHLSTGVIFRKLDPKSEEGKIVREYSARGELAPDDITIRIFVNWLESQRVAERFKPDQQFLLLDGLPRTVQQCKMLEKFIDVKLLLHFVCYDEEVMISRIRRRAVLENRPDDANESVTRKRFEIYHRETAPILAYYPKSVVREIESTSIPAEVLASCLKHLVPVLKENFPRDITTTGPAQSGRRFSNDRPPLD